MCVCWQLSRLFLALESMCEPQSEACGSFVSQRHFKTDEGGMHAQWRPCSYFPQNDTAVRHVHRLQELLIQFGPQFEEQT